jgi:hypothetical protein
VTRTFKPFTFTPTITEEKAPPQEIPAAGESAPPALADEAHAEPSPVDEVAEIQAEPFAVPAPEQGDAHVGAALVQAIEQWSIDNTHPDGRIEPSIDTPQEHLVMAALDDAHHFEDLPPEEPPAPEPVLAAIEDDAGAPATDTAEAAVAASAAGADTGGIDEPSLGEAPWSAVGTVHEPAPAEEPWSLSEPEHDGTALHAVAAVNTDAPDDGESLLDQEAAAERTVGQPALSRRERALKRARSRRDTSAFAQPGLQPGLQPEPQHELPSESQYEPLAEFQPALPSESAQQADAGNAAEDEQAAVAARMRAIAGVGEAAEEDLDHSDLSFVKRVDRSQKYGKAMKIAMAIGIPILLAGLALQAATTFRDTLAANYPQLKPTLVAVCQPFGCKVSLPTQLDALSIEQGELASLAENTFSFSTVLRNQSKASQAWPHIELTLNDNADKPVLRRVFAPHEYLPNAAEAVKGFGPRSEQSVKLYFELKELKASGYHIAIFYP